MVLDIWIYKLRSYFNCYCGFGIYDVIYAYFAKQFSVFFIKKQQFAVLGMGRFGAEITKALYNYGYEVLAVDIDEESMDFLSTTYSFFCLSVAIT